MLVKAQYLTCYMREKPHCLRETGSQCGFLCANLFIILYPRQRLHGAVLNQGLEVLLQICLGGVDGFLGSAVL